MLHGLGPNLSPRSEGVIMDGWPPGLSDCEVGGRGMCKCGRVVYVEEGELGGARKWRVVGR